MSTQNRHRTQEVLLAHYGETWAGAISDACDECRACGAEIVWALYPPTGKLAPLALLTIPGSQGTWAVERVGDKLVYRTASVADAVRFTTHFSTCPEAMSFRRVTVREHERSIAPRRPPPPAHETSTPAAKATATREAMAASESRSEDWTAAARQAAIDVANDGGAFTSDAVWELLAARQIPEPRTRSAMGPVLARLGREGVITPTGEWPVSQRAATHRRVQEWVRAQELVRVQEWVRAT